MKKLITTLLSILFALGVWAQTSGKCGDNLTWTFKESSGTLTISGTGAMWDWDPEYVDNAQLPAWAETMNAIQRIVINEGVTTIGKNAFYIPQGISVYIPSSVVRIKQYAFSADWNSAVVIENRGLNVIIQRQQPPIVEEEAFRWLPNNSILKTPLGCLTAYKTHAAWENFSFISEVGSPDGTCGEKAYWSLDDITQTLTISGEGELRGYYFGEESPWHSFKIKTVIIGESITAIGGNVFNGKYLDTLYFNPTNCIRMGDSTFPAIINYNNSNSLKTLIIGDKVTIIPGYAFYKCNNLASVTIPQSVINIGFDAGVNSINAFRDCTGLKTVNFNAINCELGGFMDCTSLEKVIIGDEVTNIPDAAFSGCHSLDSVIFPNSIRNIGQKAFYECRNLSSVILPDSIEAIKSNTFFGCENLTSIVIPNTVKTIGGNALSNCSKLAQIISRNPIPPTTGQFDNVPTSTCILKVPSKTKVAYQNIDGWKDFVNIIDDQPMQNPTGSCGDNLTWTLLLADSTLTINGIGAMTDYGNTNAPWHLFQSVIKTIKIEDSVTSFNENIFSSFDNLSAIQVNNANTSYSSLNGALFDKEKTNLLLCPPALVTLTIPESVVNVSRHAFDTTSSKLKILNYNAINCNEMGYVGVHGLPGLGGSYYFVSLLKDCNNLETINIGSKVERIPMGAFSYNKNLTTVNFNAINCIETGGYHESANWTEGRVFVSIFKECENLTSINIGNKVTRISDNLFRSCENIESVIIPSNVKVIGKYAFTACDNLASIILPNGITTIETAAFWYCKNLKSITIPNGVTSIEKETFYECSNLASISIPETVTTIGERAFSNCSNLTSITIPESVTSIGEKTFFGCSKIDSITIPQNVKEIEHRAFYGCDALNTLHFNAADCNNFTNSESPGWDNLTTVIIGDKVERIPNYFLYTHENLSSLTIGNEVTSIGDFAFSGCLNLSSITMGSKVKSFGDYTFSGCLDLSSIVIGNEVIAIGYGTFWGCSKLSSITLGNKVQTIGNYAFSKTPIKSIDIPNTTFFIGDNTFNSCDNLVSITLGKGLESIGNSAFYGCSALSSITSLNPTPPSITWNNTFDGVNRNYCKLTVIPNRKTVYQIANGWRDFLNIEELPTVDDNIKVEEESELVTISWTASDNATNYALTIYSDSNYTDIIGSFQLDTNGVPKSIKRTNQLLSCTIDDLKPSTAYYYSLIAYDTNNSVLALSDGEFETSNNLGIATEESSSTLQIYPNPVSDFFCVSGIYTDTTMTMLDINGKIVLHTVIQPNEPVFIQNLPKGIYLIRIAEKTAKIIKY